MKQFIINNKVFIIGVLSAIGVTLQQLLSIGQTDFKAIGLAVGIAVLSFISNQWRGQGVTILGIIGTASYAVVTDFQTGQHLTWTQIIMSFLAAVLAAVAPPPKAQAYENNPVIEKAKNG